MTLLRTRREGRKVGPGSSLLLARLSRVNFLRSHAAQTATVAEQ
jgi:hypothetical protein